jgi:hypothetical protein
LFHEPQRIKPKISLSTRPAFLRCFYRHPELQPHLSQDREFFDGQEGDETTAWTPEQVRTLKVLARKKTRTAQIAKTLKRTVGEFEFALPTDKLFQNEPRRVGFFAFLGEARRLRPTPADAVERMRVAPYLAAFQHATRQKAFSIGLAKSRSRPAHEPTPLLLFRDRTAACLQI